MYYYDKNGNKVKKPIKENYTHSSASSEPEKDSQSMIYAIVGAILGVLVLVGVFMWLKQGKGKKSKSSSSSSSSSKMKWGFRFY